MTLFSTSLGEIAPQIAHDATIRLFKNQLGNPGSFQVPLRQATRLPDQCRPYRSGDPVEYIDWKAFARTDQLIIREQIRSTGAVVLIDCDLTKTMQWPEPESNPNSTQPIYQKSQLAIRIAYHLAYLHVRSSDHAYIRFILPNQILGYLPKGSADVLRSFSLQRQNNFNTKDLQFFAPTWRQSRFDLRYIVSDLMSPVQTYQASSKETLTIQTLSHLEQNPDWIEEKDCYFEPTKKNREYRGRFLRKKELLKNRVDEWIRQEHKKRADRNESIVTVTEKTPMGTYLTALQSFHNGVHCNGI